MRPLLSLLALAWFLLAPLPAYAAGPAPAPAMAHQGVLDLRAHDFTAETPINLRGEWAFFWQQLLQPSDISAARLATHGAFMVAPGFWNEQRKDLPAHGYATYALTILLPESAATAPLLALKVANTSTAFRLWVDGRELFSNGQVGTSLDSERPYWRPNVISFVPQGPRITLVMQLSNYHYRKGGMWRPMALGLAPDMQKAWSEHDQFDMVLVGALLIIALGQLGLFALRPSDRSTLYFGLFCVVMVLRTAFVGDHLIEQRWPGFPFEWARKAEYLAVSLGPLILSYFFREIFRPQVNTRWMVQTFRVLMLTSAVATLAVLLLPVRWYNHLVDPMQLNLLACVLWSLVVTVRAARARDYRAHAVLLSAMVFVAAVVNDVLYARGLIATDYLAPLGFAFFLLVQTYLTARAYALSHLKTAQAESAQARGFGLLAKVQKNAGMGIWQWNPASDQVLWSETIYAIVGRALPAHSDAPLGFAGALPTSEASQTIHRDDLPAYSTFIRERVHSRSSGATHYRLVRQNGEIRHIYTEVNLEFDGQGTIAYLYGFVQDVTERQRVSDALQRLNAELEQQVSQRTEELTRMNTQLVAQNVQLEALSVTDRLTGLFNRLRLDQSLEDELQRYLRFDVPFALLLIDVDHFKTVNDAHGHAVGDQVLQQFAAILGGSTRAVDLVGRWGGEEFLVVCRETQETGAMALAEKLRQDVAAFAFPVVGQRTASFGVTSVCAGDTVARMMARADAALYRAKAAGRNRVEFERG